VVAIAKDPRVGTGKKPKGSGRRLYTDENPKDTVRIKYATPADARATARKVKKINKPYARKIQILTVMEQRSKYGGKPQQAGIAKREKLKTGKKLGFSERARAVNKGILPSKAKKNGTRKKSTKS
jgi:hypothetical protein